jgi:endonuclease YncB( thermonuclease family)
MYRLLAVVAVVLALLAFQAQAGEKEFVVTKVIDGNTIVLENGDIVRYIGIDAPHLKKNEGGPQFFAREAARFNKGLVLLKKVRVVSEGRKEADGRIIAYVYVKNTFVNGEMVKLGYARVDARQLDERYRELFLRYEKDAAARYAGLWQEQKEETTPYYVGNKRTYTFHRPSCPLSNKVSERNRIIFRDRVDPIRIGYVPCKQCKP